MGHIRNADALAIVVRCFENPQAPHPAGSVNATRDLDDLLSELVMTDLASVDRRIDATSRKAKSGDKKFGEELEFLRRLRDHLNEGHLASALRYSTLDENVLRELFLLTMKPRLYVVNVGEDALGEAGALLEGGNATPATGELACVAAARDRARAEGAEIVAVSAKLEAELGELPEEDAAEYLAALGLPTLGADRVIQAGYRALNLISFLTAGEDEVRAWTMTRGIEGARGRGQDSHRLRARLYPRRGGALRRPAGRRGLDEDGAKSTATSAWRAKSTSSATATSSSSASTSRSNRRSVQKITT